MPDASSPPCPTCGNQRCEKISERKAYSSDGGFFSTPQGSIQEIQRVYRRQCGTAFTDTLRADDARKAMG